MASSQPRAPGRRRVVTMVDGLGFSGGGERIAMEIAMGLDPARYERTLCVTRPPTAGVPEAAVGRARAELADAGVRYLELRRGSRLGLAAWRPLVGRLVRERVDILHAHKFGSNLWGGALGRLARVPVVVAHEHSWPYDGQPLRQWSDRAVIARLVDAIVAVSAADRRRMVDVERIDPALIHLIPNGIRPVPRGDGSRLRSELGIAPDAPLVGTVTRLRPAKALHLLVRAVARLRPARPALRVLIAGEGPERPALEALARELGVGDAVLLPGLRRDVPDVLAALDVVVFCSDSEGSPLALLEAMSAGRPIVATRVGGVVDMIEHDRHGLLVEAGDDAGLAAAVARLLDDPDHARALGRGAQVRRAREFDRTTMLARLEDLYDELLARGCRRAR